MITARSRYMIGDACPVLRTLPAGSVDLVMTSPPFFGLRKYVDGTGDEMGSEGSPAEFVDRLLDVIEEIARVLAPHGSMVIELGDSSSDSGGAGGDYNKGGLRAGQPKFTGTAAAKRTKPRDARHEGRDDEFYRGRAATKGSPKPGWPKAKSLCLIPESVRWALAYGRNPFNGRTTDPWIIRNVVSWVRTNPPPGQLHDKYRRGTTTLLVATKSKTRWFDDFDARTPLVENRTRKEIGPRDDKVRGRNRKVSLSADGALGAPPLDWWLIPSRTYRSKVGKHYAAFPEELCRIPILTMCPQQVCNHCGTPSRRITEPSAAYSKHIGASDMFGSDHDRANGRNRGDGKGNARITSEHVHVGWTSCGCADSLLGESWRNGVVLDPFAGTATTLAVANRLGRDAIGIDFDPRNAAIAAERIEGLAIEGEASSSTEVTT